MDAVSCGERAYLARPGLCRRAERVGQGFRSAVTETGRGGDDMEATSNDRPRGLKLLPGGATSGRVESDDERERAVLTKVAESLRSAVRELPEASSWRLPFVRFWRAVVRGLRRPE